MANTYDESRFNALYSAGYGAHLNTAAMFAHRAEALVSPGMGVSAGSSVCIVGSGFGYLAQYLVENYQFNTNNLMLIDNSPYVWANMATQQSIQAIVDALLNVNILDTLLLSLIGGNSARSNWIISDDCIADFTDLEIPLFITQCELIQRGNGGIVHLVTTTSDGANPEY